MDPRKVNPFEYVVTLVGLGLVGWIVLRAMRDR
jgi:hypothetical protein